MTQRFPPHSLNPDNHAATHMNIQSDDEPSSNLLLKSTLKSNLEGFRLHMTLAS